MTRRVCGPIAARLRYADLLDRWSVAGEHIALDSNPPRSLTPSLGDCSVHDRRVGSLGGTSTYMPTRTRNGPTPQASQMSEPTREERVARIERALRPGGLTMAFQPVVNLRSGHVTGAEALARFQIEP